MRDDVAARIKELIALYKEKLVLIQNIITTNKKCISYLTSNEITIVEETLETDNNTIERVNLLDYHITELKSIICKRSGIPLSSFEQYFMHSEREHNEKLAQLMMEISSAISEAYNGRQHIITELEHKMAGVQQDIKEINVLRKTKKMLKNLQE